MNSAGDKLQHDQRDAFIISATGLGRDRVKRTYDHLGFYMKMGRVVSHCMHVNGLPTVYT